MRNALFRIFTILYPFLLMALETNSTCLEKNDLPDGVYAAVLTPMHADLMCNYEKLTSHCFDLVEQGCVGVALFGTTGEGASFSVKERLEALQYLIAEKFDPKRIILANGSSGIQDTIELGRESVRLGCAAFLVSPPSFYKNVSEEGVLLFYREVIQKIANPNLRLILYHIPQLSGIPISLHIIEKLRQEFPEIVMGIKESEENLPFTKNILESFPGFRVFVGKESQIIESVHLGGSGAICGIANLYPDLMCSLYKQGKKANAPNPQAIEDIFRALKGLPFIAAAKALMEQRQGKSWSVVRPPLIPLTQIQRESFIAALQDYGLESK